MGIARRGPGGARRNDRREIHCRRVACGLLGCAQHGGFHAVFCRPVSLHWYAGPQWPPHRQAPHRGDPTALAAGPGSLERRWGL